jgi:xylulokinase
MSCSTSLRPRSRRGSDGVLCLPYFLGEKTPIHDPLARGTFIGLTLGNGKGHIWRALLEGVAYGFRHHIDVLADMGHAPRRFFASDGGTKSRVWMQIMADVIGAPVQLLDNPYGSSVGAAWVAAIGTGLASDWNGISRLATRGALIEPNPANRTVYDNGYARYRATYEALKPVFAMPL